MNDPEGSGKIFPASIGSTPTFAETEAKPVRPVVWAGNMPAWRGRPPQPRPVWPLIMLLVGMSITLLVFVPAGDYYKYEVRRDYQTYADLGTINNIHGGGMLVYYILLVAYFVVLQIWIWRVTRDACILSGGRFAPKPGAALGLLYVPFFHYVWVWLVLRRLSSFPRRSVAADERRPGFAWLTAYLVLAGGAVVAWIVVAAIFNRYFFFNFRGTPLHAYIQMAWANGAFVILNAACNVALIFAIRKIGHATAAHTESAMNNTSTFKPTTRPNLPPSVMLAQAGPWHMRRIGRVGVVVGMFIPFTVLFLLIAGISLAMALGGRSNSVIAAPLPALMMGFGIAYFVVLLVWTWRVHDGFGMLTQGAYRPTPGMAMGLLFVPVFQWFYLAWILYRLSRHAARTEASGRRVPGSRSLLVYSLAMGITFIGAVILAVIYERVRADFGDLPLQIMGVYLLTLLAIANTALVAAFLTISRAVGCYVRTALSRLPLETPSYLPPISLPVSSPPT